MHNKRKLTRNQYLSSIGEAYVTNPKVLSVQLKTFFIS